MNYPSGPTLYEASPLPLHAPDGFFSPGAQIAGACAGREGQMLTEVSRS